MSINKVFVSGNIGNEPQLRQTASGVGILSFCVAVNDRKKNAQTGEWEDRTNWVDCTIFGKRAESLSSHLHKGMKVAIEGKLHYSSWEKDGQKRSKLDVTVDEIEFMSQRGSNSTSEESSSQEPVEVEATVYDGSSSVYDDDIPF